MNVRTTVVVRQQKLTGRTAELRLNRAVMNDPKNRAKVRGLTEEVADEAKLILSGVGKASVRNPSRVRGHYWSSSPSAIAKLVKRKDLGVNFPRFGNDFKTFVGLVVADHPYSLMYQYGGNGAPITRFMTTALRRVAARNSGVGVDTRTRGTGR